MEQTLQEHQVHGRENVQVSKIRRNEKKVNVIWHGTSSKQKYLMNGMRMWSVSNYMTARINNYSHIYWKRIGMKRNNKYFGKIHNVIVHNPYKMRNIQKRKFTNIV
jgi:hypothetical protein